MKCKVISWKKREMRRGVVASNTRPTRDDGNVWRSSITLLENDVSFEVLSMCAEDHLWEDYAGREVTLMMMARQGVTSSVVLVEQQVQRTSTCLH